MRSIINIKNIGIAIVVIVLALTMTITCSMSIYSNRYEDLVINMQPNTKIKGMFVNNVKTSLSYFAKNAEELEYKEDLLICKEQYNLEIKKSLIDDIYIEFEEVNNASIELNDQNLEIYQNVCYANKSFFGIIKDTISLTSIAIFIGSLIISVLTVYLFLKTLSKFKEDKIKVYNILLFAISIFIMYISSVYLLMIVNKIFAILPLAILLIFTLLYLKNSINNWHNIFAIFSSIIGIYVLLILPPGQVPDEPSHYLRSYVDIDNSLKTSDGNAKLPDSVLDVFDTFTSDVHSKDQKFSGKDFIKRLTINHEFNKVSGKKIDYSNTKHLSFFTYLPSNLVNIIGRILNISPLLVFFIARLVNIMISIILCYYAIKITPCFKKIFTLVSLFPVFIQQSFGINQDFLTNAIALLFIAYVLKYKFENKNITLKNMILLFSLGIALSLCKFGYFPLLLLVILIPNEKFEKKRMAIFIKIAIILIPIMIACFMNLTVMKNTDTNDSYDHYTIANIIKEPIHFIKVSLKTLFLRWDLDLFRGLLDGFAWSTKYHYSIILWTISSIYIIMLFIGEESNLKIKDRIVLVLVFGMIFAMLYAVAYTWTTYGGDVIIGLQSRYFIPILPLFYIAISNNMLKLNVKNKYRFYIILLSVVQFLFATSILIGFY